MLTYFPPLYEDELLYSWFARYHIHSSNVSPKQTMKDLYGKPNAIAVPDLPTNLLNVYKKLSLFGVPSVKEWIYKHTFFRYYTTFSPDTTKDKVYKAMEDGELPGAIHMMTGVMASSIKEGTYFRFCPKCVKEDFEVHGETYWRLTHQLPGVFYCLKHQQYLCNSTVKFRSKNKHEFKAATKTNCATINKNYNHSIKIKYFLKMITEQIVSLISEDWSFTTVGIQNAYKYLLQKQGYATFTGKVDQLKLAKQFTLYYGEEFLEAVQCKVSYENESCWLKNITRKHRKSFHPIKHILFIHFLGEDISTFYEYQKRNYKPFGDGPYYCLNPATDHYKHRVVDDLKVTACTDTRRPVGTFKCSCGFIYSRRGPDTKIEDQFKIGRIKQFGQVWMDKLNNLISVKKKSYYAASKELKCDISTIKKYYEKQELVSNDEDDTTAFHIVEKHNQWISLLNQHSGMSVTELRKIEPALYTWLYRHNKEWLKSNSPKQDVRQTTSTKVNWKERDEIVLGEVKKVIENLRNQDKPIFINKSRIAKEINQLALIEKHFDKLPKTSCYISKNVESREDYQIRRIQWACKELDNEGIELVEWRIKRKAGLKRNINDRVQKAIVDEIEKYKVGDNHG